MKIKPFALILLCAWLAGLSDAVAQGTAFTYQGRLIDGSNSASGSYDLVFTLYNSVTNGSVAGGPRTNSAVAITNGLFLVNLDFGAVFSGTNYWLDVSVRTNGAGSFVELAPRQPVTPEPYAIMARSASNLLGSLPPAQLAAGTAAISVSGSAATVTGSFTGDVTGKQSTTVVSKVGGVTAANVAAGANTANAATNSDSPGTIVKRDGSGNFSAASLSLDNLLTLPANNASIYSGSNLVLRADGQSNFFAGPAAGNLSVSGQDNTGVGQSALFLNTGGYRNTVIGSGAMYNNNGGSRGTAVGYQALSANIQGDFNVAVGCQALFSNVYGYQNTAVGTFTLYYNSNGINNTALGYEALGLNTSGYNDTAAGSQALYQNLLGLNNTATGFSALYWNFDGNENTADGSLALDNNVHGIANTAIGYSTLFNNYTGSYNTAVGDDALYENNAGFNNAAIGYQALYSNTNGTGNVAVGMNSLYYNTSGGNNTAVGAAALYFNTNGICNTVVGTDALFQNNNSYNTVIGCSAMFSSTNGTNNIVIGYKAGYNVANGNNGIFIGNPGLATEGNTIRIGVAGVQDLAYIAGIYGVIDNSGLAVYVEPDGRLATAPSSRRFKTDIQSMDEASDVLLALRPVTFHYRRELVARDRTQFGLVAEEVSSVAPDLVVRDDKNEITGVRYEAVNAMLLNEFLKEHHRVAEQNEKLQELGERVDVQSAENEALKQRLEALERIVLNRETK